MGPSQRKNDQDSIASIARDLIMRVQWERELASPGCARWDPAQEVAPQRVREPEVAPQRVREPEVAPQRVREPEVIPSTEEIGGLDAIEEKLGECTRCGLHRGRTNIVFGAGEPHARLVFMGEGPGHEEDIAGKPFVGAAGQLLDKIIQAIGLNREQVYILNVVKCRPPNNRVPLPEESAICGEFALEQLASIRPEVVVALGRTAAAYLLQCDEPLGKLRGRFHDVRGMKVMPTYHPAYLLRNPGAKRQVWDDMKKVMALLGLPMSHLRRKS